MAADARDQVTAEAGARASGAEAPARPPVADRPGTSALAAQAPQPPDAWSADTHAPARAAAPVPVPLPDAGGPRDAVTRLRAHGCWYPSATADGAEAAFICDRGGVPQLWAGPVDSDEVRLLDSSPDPVKEVSWSPDGRWIAYTTAPGGGEHSRVLCVRPDGTGRRILAGADPGSSAYLGCWTHDGSAVAVTVAATTHAHPDRGGHASTDRDPGGAPLPPDRSDRDGRATLLGGTPYGSGQRTAPAPVDLTAPQAPAVRPGGGLSAYLIDPDGPASPVLLATETHAATLRVCDLSRDGTLALLRRGPRGRREAVVRRTADSATMCTVPVADGDPWIGRFSPDGRTLWLRSDADREYAALFALALAPDGEPRGTSVVAQREDQELELLALAHDGRTAVLVWNAQGAGELELVETSRARHGPDDTGPARPVSLPHEVVTRVVAAGPGRMLLALSGSQRRPGVWWAHEGVSLLRTPWSSRDEDAVPPGRPPVRPVPLRLAARDGLPLSGWYYRAPGRAPGEPAPCVIHLHGGPEEQERPVFNPLYHELLGRGLDVFAPDVRGSSGHGRSFVDADLGAGRFAALDDVADCTAHAVTAGPADPTRLAVMGRSYGGYLTFAALVRHPDLFRTGVAVCGMSDLLTFFAGTEPWIADSAVHKYGHPEHDRALLRALSPMSRVDALRVPVLAVHGEHDNNVPPGESEQFVRAARERGIPAELLTLRDEGHEFLRADSRRLFRRAAADWLQRHLGG
ncbi:S9 family peptidase [Streptomyces sp. WI04-05B]|uniref:alpha/beta fold hydrolase n=1 Tax=Streptomyces TaxID=1883 RepID=UPI0029BE6610|nr:MULTISPECIES: alpha/beta fold hydrolase [unclassified Streptomyces]MDX2541506.1 prolyl oligopeptidase family serine peptidase [Streptomyces sp. WI04-05B]MDX2583760.1 prolyl oligopeptidase family serine peptidase [Streptomyces sp. WI04-05A]